MSNQYILRVINNSTNPTNIAVFQNDPNIASSGTVFNLAWYTKFAYPKTKFKFAWETSYNFVWSETGTLAAGVVFDAIQHIDANLEEMNEIELDYDPQNRAYFFNPSKAKKVRPLGKLRIKQSDRIPLKQASVGIGMAGKGTFVVAHLG